jgi:hypothetical protein
MEEVNCPVDDCENCEFHRTESWCAQAIPKPPEINDIYKAHMEGFWEALRYAEDEYRLMVEFYDTTNDYIAVLEKLIELCYADDRPPTAEEVAQVESYWNGEK